MYGIFFVLAHSVHVCALLHHLQYPVHPMAVEIYMPSAASVADHLGLRHPL